MEKLPKELVSALERLEGTEAARAIRHLVWEQAAAWRPGTIAPPDSVSERTREYHAGGVAALEDLYAQLAKILKWRRGASDGQG